LAVVAAALASFLVLSPFGPGAETFLDIPPGTGTPEMARMLQKQGIIRSAAGFEALRLVRGGTLHAGEYRFDGRAPMTSVYDRLVRGDVYTRTLLIPEGYNIFDIANAVQAAGLGSAQEFLAAERAHTDLISGWTGDRRAASLEGFLFPDTYRFSRHSSPEKMLQTMVRRFERAAAQLGLSGDISRTVTMASLLEKEVAQPAERPLVAGVFENRLSRGIPLQTDPSVIYAALLNGRYKGTIYASDLQFDSPYNTYRHAGLPPGPICSPGMAALKAAMAPAKTDFLYFVSDAAGHSRFAATLSEHTRNVQAYRQAQTR
jgi:UPF0755 protein